MIVANQISLLKLDMLKGLMWFDLSIPQMQVAGLQNASQILGGWKTSCPEAIVLKLD